MQIHGILIDNSDSSLTKAFYDSLSCGSQCSVGGCYMSGLLGSLKSRATPSLSCVVCQKGMKNLNTIFIIVT